MAHNNVKSQVNLIKFTTKTCNDSANTISVGNEFHTSMLRFKKKCLQMSREQYGLTSLKQWVTYDLLRLLY